MKDFQSLLLKVIFIYLSLNRSYRHFAITIKNFEWAFLIMNSYSKETQYS